jgi:hypothetical protein
MEGEKKKKKRGGEKKKKKIIYSYPSTNIQTKTTEKFDAEKP